MQYKSSRKNVTMMIIFLVVILCASAVLFAACTPKNPGSIGKVYVRDMTRSNLFVLGEFELRGTQTSSPDKNEFTVANDKTFTKKIKADPRLVATSEGGTKGNNGYWVEYLFFENDFYYRLLKDLGDTYILRPDYIYVTRAEDGTGYYRLPINADAEAEKPSVGGKKGDIIKANRAWEYYVEYYARLGAEKAAVDEINKTILVKGVRMVPGSGYYESYIRLTWAGERTFTAEYDVDIPE